MNKIYNTITDLVLFFESFKGKKLNALFQIIAALSAALYKYTESQNAPQYIINNRDVFSTSFIVSTTLILLATILVFIFYKQFDLNVLKYDKKNGELYDERLLFSNVALRRETIRQMLISIYDSHTDKAISSEQLRKLGFGIGMNFVKTYKDAPKSRQVNKKDLLLKYLLRYDSSSGMGLFELIDSDFQTKKPWIKIIVKNPLTHTIKDSRNDDIFCFVEGYLQGICTAVFEISFTLDNKVEEHEAYELKFQKNNEEQ